MSQSQAIPSQHPAVVLRSHYRQLRALLAVAMIGVVGLTAAVVILVIEDDRDLSNVSATQVGTGGVAGTVRYDGGPEEGTRGALATRQRVVVRYDGGPEEGTRGALATRQPVVVRYDGGPEEGSRGSGH
jgi:hypothetical protein